MKLNEFVGQYGLVLHSLNRISVPNWSVTARVEHDVQFVNCVCRKRFVVTAVNKCQGTEFDVGLAMWVKHTLEMFDDFHNYEVLVGVNVTDLKGARPIELVDIAYKRSDGLLLVGREPDNFKTLEEWLEVIVDSVQQIQVHL